MSKLPKNIKYYLALVVLVACVGVVAAMSLFASSGIFPININDGANFPLEALYAAQGLIPYRDYGFVYPPGIAIFFGDLLHITDGGVFLHIVWLINFIILSTNSYLLSKLTTGAVRFIGAGVLLLVFVQPQLVLFHSHGTEIFTTPLLLTLLLLSLLQLRAKTDSTPRLVMLSVCAFIVTMVRWDRALGFGLVEFGLAAGLWMLVWRGFFRARDKDKILFQVRQLSLASIAVLIGVTMATSFIAWYALGSDTWSDVWWFLIGLPGQTMPYRTLPLAPFISIFNPENLWAMCGMVFVIAVVGFYQVKRSTHLPSRYPISLSEFLLLLSSVVAVVPYALGRSDAVHFMPLASMLAAVLIIVSVICKDVKIYAAFFVLLLLLLAPMSAQITGLYGVFNEVEHTGFSVFQHGLFRQNLEAATEDCTHLIPSDAKSIFVGRESYAHFIVGPVILYLARHDLRPASTYVAEDPGIQNSCNYGAEIARDLRRAQRPMVAFLNRNPQWREPNATQTMQSCGQIEKMLKETPSKTLGSCRVGAEIMSVVIY